MATMIGLLILGVSLTAIWQAFRVGHRAYMVDQTRQRLFVLRDRLFDRALEGKVPLDSEAYALTRRIINANIRFTHDLSLLRLVVLLYQFRTNRLLRAAVTHLEQQINAAVSGLDETGQLIIRETFRQLHEQLILHIVKTSMFMLATIVLASLVLAPMIILPLVRRRAAVGLAAVRAGIRSAVVSIMLRLQNWSAVDFEAQLLPA